MYVAKINPHIDKHILCVWGETKTKKNPNGVLVQVIPWMNLKNMMIGDRNQ